MVGSKDLPPSHKPFFTGVFVQNQFRTKAQYPPKDTDLSGHVTIITGGNSGLGYEAGRQLLTYKLSHLILACRSQERGEAAAQKLRAMHPKATIDVWQLDMSSYDSIQKFARRAEAELSRLDIVILNAGLNNFSRRTVPSTGHEEVMQVNYISQALLTILLLPTLKSKAPPNRPGHLTLVNGALALTSQFPKPEGQETIFQYLDDPKHYSSQGHYCLSKALAHAFLWKLVDYVSRDDIIVNLADPAYVKGTSLARDITNPLIKAAGAVFELTGRTVEMGASTIVDAVVTKGEESHGAFIMSYEIHPFNANLYQSDGQNVIEKIWEDTLKELDFANVRQILESIKMGV